MDILSTLQHQKEVMEIQNRNMAKAIEMIEKRKREQQQVFKMFKLGNKIP